MTRQEFEEGYARRSGVTVDWLHEMGQHGEPCGCGEEGCRGWQMAGPDPWSATGILDKGRAGRAPAPE